MPEASKSILRSLQLVSGPVPCTDGARRLMRHELEALQLWLGLPVLFVTLNPADTKHPFVFYFGTDAATKWVPVDTDPALFTLLEHVDLAHRVAVDPVAVARAFHAHVHAFFSDLLHCSKACAPDGLPAMDAAGIFGPIAGYYAVTGPQMRGSLHLHMLLHLYGFATPAAFLRAFSESLPQLKEKLLQWTQTILSTALESVPVSLGCPDAAQRLKHLQALPYSSRHAALLGVELGHSWDLDLASTAWSYGSPNAIVAAPPWFDPCHDAQHGRPSFLPWPRRALTSLRRGTQEWAELLLYDLRHSIVHCCLHECRPRTCYKGFLGRLGFCRLGYWFWKDVSSFTEPETWQRCHGIPPVHHACVGDLPPFDGIFRTERYHPFHTRFNPAMLSTCKCNHDVNILVQIPSAAADMDRADFAACMATSVRTATYYVTAYMSKVQPQITNLWQLLARGQSRLAADLQEMAAATEDPLTPAYVAKRVLTRMLMTCQRRAHKSMPEICHYLLGFPEAYASHSFRRLFLMHPLRRAQLLLPHLHPSPAAPEVSTILRAADRGGDAVPTADQDVDYCYRWEPLALFPFYFYVAAITRVSSKAPAPERILVPFQAAHPLAASFFQCIALEDAWSVPRLVGPRIPLATHDPELRALLLLLLLKPWSCFDLSDLLRPVAVGATHAMFPTWTAAWDDFLLALHAAAGDLSLRPPPFTARYWSHRALALQFRFFPQSFCSTYRP